MSVALKTRRVNNNDKEYFESHKAIVVRKQEPITIDKLSEKFLSEDQSYEVKTIARLVTDIIKRRNELGMTQEELAREAGIPQSSLARFERKGVFPRIDTLCKIARPLGLTLRFTIN